MTHRLQSEDRDPAHPLDDLHRTAYATRLALATWDRESVEDPLGASAFQRAGSSRGAFDRLAEVAARLLDTQFAQVSVIAAEQHVVGGAGLPSGAVGAVSPAEDSLCTVTTRLAAPLVISDAPGDPRVNHLPPVTSGAVGAYLGVPLVSQTMGVGALCVFDPSPRAWDDRDVSVLETLADQVVAELELAADLASFHDDRMIWRLAVDAAGVGAFDWHLATDELRWDDRLLALFGLTRETFGGNIEAFNACVHPDDVGRVGAALQRAIAECGSYEAEYRVVWPDGQVRWIAARGEVLAGLDGKALKIVGAAYDTTDVHEADNRVARVLESMPTAFYQVDADWRFTYVNATAERVLGMSREELVGANLWELFPGAIGTDFDVRYREAVATGEPVGFDAYYPPPFEGWYEVRAWPSSGGLAVYFIDVTSRYRAQQQLDSAAKRGEILTTLSGALTNTLDIEDAVRTLAPLVTPQLADWSVVTVVNDDHVTPDWRVGLRDIGFWHTDPEKRGLVERYAAARLAALTPQSFVARAVTSDGPVVIPGHAATSVSATLAPGEARELIAELDPGSGVIVPLRGRGRVVGLLSLFREAGRERFTADDLALLEDISVRAGLAIDNARLFGQQREVAETLQRSLLSEPRHHADLDVAVRYEPAADAAQVGGDWYDAFLHHDGSTMVVIGDVVGHDIAAAAAMGQIRSLVRGIAFHTPEGPAALMRGVDRAMVGLDAETTATAIIARMDGLEDGSGRHRMRWSNAGHPPPMVLRADGRVEVLELEQADLLLGLAPEVDRQERTVVLNPGDTVLLYTDGLVERRLAGLDQGLQELSRMLTDLGPERGCDELAERVVRGLMPHQADDDVAVLALRLRPL